MCAALLLLNEIGSDDEEGSAQGARRTPAHAYRTTPDLLIACELVHIRKIFTPGAVSLSPTCDPCR